MGCVFLERAVLPLLMFHFDGMGRRVTQVLQGSSHFVFSLET